MEKKSDLLVVCIHKNDLLIFLTQIAWENKFIAQNQYVLLSDKLYEIGKMLGGWKKGVEDMQNKQK